MRYPFGILQNWRNVLRKSLTPPVPPTPYPPFTGWPYEFPIYSEDVQHGYSLAVQRLDASTNMSINIEYKRLGDNYYTVFTTYLSAGNSGTSFSYGGDLELNSVIRIDEPVNGQIDKLVIDGFVIFDNM